MHDDEIRGPSTAPREDAECQKLSYAELGMGQGVLGIISDSQTQKWWRPCPVNFPECPTSNSNSHNGNNNHGKGEIIRRVVKVIV